MTKLSGDVAYDLFVSSEPFPLHQFLDDWKADKIEGHTGFILAVIGAYRTMTENCTDGRYQGVIRKG